MCFSPSRSSVYAALVCSSAILALLFPFLLVCLHGFLGMFFGYFSFSNSSFFSFRFAFFSLGFHFFFFCLKRGNVGMCSDVMYVRCMHGMRRASS